MTTADWRRVWLVGLTGLCCCAGIERGQYGVSELRFEQVERVNQRALAACLLTRERDSFALKLGDSEYLCNQPPFDSADARVTLWTWPWTDWPLFNQAVFDKDIKRILRWYRARGFYDARIVEIRYDPPYAARLDQAPPESSCDPNREECEVEITVVVQEGQPVMTASVRVFGIEALPISVRQQIAEVSLPVIGERFDESDYDAAKASLVETLAEASYAGARVTGTFEIKRDRREAHLSYRVIPGAPYRFGKITVLGHESLPVQPIIDAAAIEGGAPFRQSALAEAEREIYALEAFSLVEVKRELVPEQSVANVRIRVEPLKPHLFRLGLGVMSGATRRTASGTFKDVPQWDLHLFTRYEMQRLFGGLGKLRLEERPRIIMNKSFPGTTAPHFGNILEATIRQPAFPERRTMLVPVARWDWGPDPFLGFRRSDLLLRIALERPLYKRLLFGILAIQQDIYLVDQGDETSDGSELPTGYGFRFIEEDLRLELRDNPVQPSEGLYLQLLSSQALRSPGSSWTLLRLSPEVRGYIPLPFGMVIAGRFGVAALFIASADQRLDDFAQRFGPLPYRLRGGGANSNRGFLPGRLGDGVQGGLRRWEGSLELRVKLGQDFSLAFFGDVGDVHQGSSYRFDHLNTSVGFGLRYLTLVGPIRFDIGFRLPALQRVDGSDGIEDDANELPLIDHPGALHLTIGEAF